MKSIPFFAAIMLLTPSLDAGNKNCCRVRTCNPCGTSTASATQWYTAKDGTLREKMPYREALSRAEDADDMEIVLRGVHEELTVAQTAAAEQKEALDAELAALRKQLEEQLAATVAQTARADKAEATLTQVQAQLKEATVAGAELTNQVKSLTEEREKLAAAAKTAADELNVLKQAAAKTEKVVVATDDYDADPPQDDEEDASAEETPAAE